MRAPTLLPVLCAAWTASAFQPTALRPALRRAKAAASLRPPALRAEGPETGNVGEEPLVAVWNAAALVASGGVVLTAAEYFPSVWPTPALLLLVSRIAAVQSSAAKRGRSGASTFRVLDVGLAAGAAVGAVGVAAVAATSPGMLSTTGGAFAALGFAALGVPPALSLLKHGLPTALKFPLTGEPLTWLLALLQVEGLVRAACLAAAGQVGAAALMLPLLAALNAAQDAAAVGPDRLASRTYLELNVMIGIVGVSRALVGGDLGGPLAFNGWNGAWTAIGGTIGVLKGLGF